MDAVERGSMRKQDKIQEWITGIIIGLVLSLLLAVKVFAAPVSETDAELLAKTVEAEAGNQSIEGKRLVAAVVLNRVENAAFPDTIEDVLSQPKQFTTYRNLDNTEATWQDKLAVKMELETRSNKEVIYFRRDHYGTGTPLMKVGDHYFSTI